MRKIHIICAFALTLTPITAQDSTSSAGAVTESINTVNSDSQQISTPSVQNTSTSTDTATPSSNQNETQLSTESAGILPDSADIDSASQQTKSLIIQETEEDLFLDGGEENIISPTAATEPTQPAQQLSDSIIPKNPEVNDNATAQQDSLLENQKQFLSHYPEEAMPKIEEESKPILIEKTQSINFAKNFKEYRSPKVAIGLSLLLPGAGQAYSHHKLKTGIFGFIEVAFIAAGAIVGFQGNKRMKDARKFANSNYSIEDFEDYYSKLQKFYEDKDFDIDSQIFISYIDHETFKKEANDKSQSYYNYISHEVSPYIQGWKDVTPRFNDDFKPVNVSDSGRFEQNEDSLYLVFFVNNNGDSSSAQYGFSEKQKEFNKKLSKANSYFRWSKSLFTMLLINHVISAIDAGITAKAYNDKLLGKNTVWQKFNLNQTVVSTPTGPAQGFSLEVRF